MDNVKNWKWPFRFKIGEHLLDPRHMPRPAILEQMSTRLTNNTWSCCLLGRLERRGRVHVAFVLLIERLDGEKAQRLDSLLLWWYSPENEGNDIETYLETRDVTLV